MDDMLLETLYKKGLLIDPEHLDIYLKKFTHEKGKKEPMANFWNGKRVAITGISGFAGSYLAEQLLELHAQVVGLVRRHAVPDYRNIAHIMNNIKLAEGNLNDFGSLLRMVKKYEPEVIFHLGAQSFVPTSFRNPIETYENNIIGTANLLECVRISEIPIEAIHLACSSEEYGMVYLNELPIKETNPFRPQSPYAVSKVITESLGVLHHEVYGVPSIITRAFNHSGPRRGLQFATSVIARQIARVMLKGGNVVTIGNGKPIRDFTDVRDIVRGYLLAVEHAKKGEPYNLGHGVGITIENLIKLAAQQNNLQIRIEIDQERFRPKEVEALICDYSKAKEQFGYEPTIPLTETVQNSIEYFKSNPSLLDTERH